jgi:hypothetical protein
MALCLLVCRVAVYVAAANMRGIMNNIIYLVGLVVVILAVLYFFGLA